MLQATPPTASTRLVRFLEALALAAVVIVSTGYRFGTGMQLMLVPHLRRLADPEHLRNDWLIGLVPKHYNVTWLLAALSRLMSLELLFFLAHVAATLLFVVALRRVSRVLFGAGPAFYLALFLLLRWGGGGLGGNLLFGDYFNPHTLGVPFCALALAYALEGRFVHGALLAGIATDVHMLLGLDLFLVLAIAELLAARPVDPARLTGGMLVYALVSLPTLLPVAVLAGGSEALDSAEFLRIHVWMRNPHHYAPSAWPLEDYAKFGFVVLFAALASLRSRPVPEVHRRVVALCSAVALLCLVATFAVEVVPLEIPTKLQFFRMTIFVRLFVVLYVASFLAATLAESGPRRIGALALLAAPPRLALLVPAAGTALLPAEPRRRRRWLAALAAATGVLAAAIVAGGHLPSALPQNRATPAMLAAAVVGAAALAALLALARRLTPRRPDRLFALSLLALFAATRLAKGPAFEYRLPDATRSPWAEACHWIRDHTPPDAVFLAPPDHGDFRLLAERAQVVDFKGNTFWERDIVEWKRRLDDLANSSDLDCRGLGECRAALRAGYASLREADFQRLGRKYGAAYALTETELPGLPRVHSSGTFHLYRLTVAGDLAAPPQSR